MHLMRDGDEPIPGYKLVRKLGQGGFGSVWKADGPGVSCALKFLSLGDTLGRKEYQAIRLLRNIRHPNLIPMAAFWLRDGNGNILGGEDNRGSSEFQARNTELIIQLGLGDKSLADRLAECRGGQAATSIVGLPTDELLRYMVQAASAIDYLNRPIHALGGTSPAALRHGDIKPGNMLITGDGVWVCDFGLAGILGGSDIRTSAGKPMYTPAYAAPEILSYKGPSKTSDQYSLAVSYVEMRTGRLPYDAETKHAVEALITIGDIYLDFMSGPEQKVLRRAMAMNPNDRFPTCAEFVEELKKAVGEQSGRMGRPPTAEDLFCRDSAVVPGYKLETCLGRGGYGEVWQASGNRMKVALKIVKNLDDKKGKQEWAALESIKEELDHPHLMKLQGYWLFDAWGKVISEEEQDRAGGPKPAYLVIHTDLAAKNLLDRLKECQNAGQNGIPLKELLEYVRQSADALDYLNQERHSFGDREGIIIHRDIKPENILLTHKSKVKISDFGLAKMMEGSFSAVSRNSEGWTLIYGAPELHKRNLSRWTDQYSLAVTYYHLRTGHPPIDTSLPTLELAIRSGLGQLDLGGLPDAERAVIARATMVTPEQRFDTCSEMVAALYAAAGSSLPLQSGHEVPPMSDLPSSGASAAVAPSGMGSTPSSGLPIRNDSGVTSDYSDPSYQKKFSSGPAVAEMAKRVSEAKRLEDLGLLRTSDTHSPHDAVRDTPGPKSIGAQGTSPHSSGHLSSGDYAVPTHARDDNRKTDRSRQTFVGDFDDEPKPASAPKNDWRGDSGRKTTTKPAPAEEDTDWRRPKKGGSPPVAVFVGGGIGLAAVIGLVIYLVGIGGGNSAPNEALWLERLAKIVNVESPSSVEKAEATDLLAKLESAKHSDAKTWHGKVDSWIVNTATKQLRTIMAKSPTPGDVQEAEKQLQELKKHMPEDQYAKLDADFRGWKNPSNKQRDIVRAAIERVNQIDNETLTKANITDVESQVMSLKSTNDIDDARMAETCLKTLSDKKAAAGKAQLKSLIRTAPRPPLTDKAAGSEFKRRIDDLKTYWLVNAELATEEKRALAAAQALAQSWTEDKVDKVADVLRSEPSALLAQLISEFLRLTKPSERGNTLQGLWKNKDRLPTEGRESLVAYHDQLSGEILKPLAASTLNEADIKVKCAAAKGLDPNDALAVMAETELQLEKSSAAPTPEQATRIRGINANSEPGLNKFYSGYMRAVIKSTDDAAGAADELATLFPDKGEADPLSQNTYRRKRASAIFAAAAAAQQRETKNPFDLPFEGDALKKIDSWVATACRIDSGNRQAWAAAAVIASFGPSPNPEQANKAIGELAKSWPDEKAAGKYWFLLNLARAESLAGSSAASDRADALSMYADALNSLKKIDTQIRGNEAMTRLKAVFQKAIDLGDKLHASNSSASIANRLAQMYGLRGGWVFDRPLDWGHVSPSDAYTAAAADFKKAIDLSDNSADKANFRVGKVYADLKLKKINLAEAEKEAEAICALQADTPRPRGLLALMKMDRAIELMAQDKRKSNATFSESLIEYEIAVSQCQSADDSLRKAIFLDNASRICRTLAAEGVDTDANIRKASQYAAQAAEMRVFDDALGRSSQGKLLEDKALTLGDGSQYPLAIMAFDKAIMFDQKPQYYVDRGRIRLRGVAYGKLKWTDIDKARADLKRVIENNYKDASAAVRAEAHYFLSHSEILEHKLKTSATSFEQVLNLLPADAIDHRFSYQSGRGRSLALEAEWLQEDQRHVPDDLVKELNAIADAIASRDSFGAAWLRGVVAGLDRKIQPTTGAEKFLAGLPAKFPQDTDGLVAKADGKNTYPSIFPLLGWMRLYLRSSEVEAKYELTPEKLAALADILAEGGKVSSKQDVWLWAATAATAGQAHIFAASKQVGGPAVEQQYRERGIKLLREAVSLVSPKFPTSWNWRFELGRELERSLVRPDLPAAERVQRIAEARIVLTDAKDESTDEGRRKIEELLQKLPK